MPLDPPANPSVHGAYGLRLSGIGLPAERLSELPASAPVWHLEARAASATPAARPTSPHAPADLPPTVDEPASAGALHIELTADHAQIAVDGSRLELDRAARRAIITTDGPLDPEFIVHPFAAGIGACAAHWSGALALHGGAVLIDGRAWLILADRAEGKSTTLAALREAGHPILTDDLIVTDRAQQVAAGPRSLDLRAPHPAFPEAVALPRADRRERYRIHPGSAPAAAPLGGVLRLAWSTGAPGLHPVDATERLAFLSAARTIQGAGGNGMLLLDVATAPMAILHRPRELSTLPQVVDLIEQFAARS